MEEALNNAGVFLISLAFELYVFVLLLRLLMQYYHVSYFNPVAQITVQLTDFIVKPLQRYCPTYKSIDMAVVLLLVVTAMLKTVLLVLLATGQLGNIIGVFIWSIGALLGSFVNLYFYLIIIRVILSWVAPMGNHPVIRLVFMVTEVPMAMVRRLIPPISGIDLSPLFLLIGLQLVSIIVSGPIIRMGMNLV